MKKNQILDDLIRDSFTDFLEKGERIYWIDQPNLKRKNPWKLLIVKITLSIFVIFTILGSNSDIKIWWHRIIVLMIIALMFYISLWTKKKDLEQIQYAITSKNIIFKLTKSEFHKIPLTNIFNIKILENKNHFPSVELITKEPVHFKTYTIHSNKKKMGSKRKTPTLEHIENTEEIIQLINQLTRPYNYP